MGRMMLWGGTLREHSPTREASYTPRVPNYASEAGWVVRIGESYGELCAEVHQGAGAGVDAAIDRHVRLLNQWRRERES